ncbi:MAG: CYTH domain-containing protein [Candidatus Azambacteria bacterium]|nr:CYTH domain-containing protein [Candidatus Azambacteria bacterium]
MASIFECEVRYEIDNIKKFESRLKKLGANLLYPYSFEDYYYRPVKEKWNPSEKILRIRKWRYPKKPAEILFVKNEIISINGIKFKRSLYPQGKVLLFNGEFNICETLLHDLGFIPWFVLNKKKANFWKIKKYNFKTVTEYIENLGWNGELEFEGKNIQKAKTKIKKALEILEIAPKLVSFEPISLIYARKNKLL